VVGVSTEKWTQRRNKVVGVSTKKWTQRRNEVVGVSTKKWTLFGGQIGCVRLVADSAGAYWEMIQAMMTIDPSQFRIISIFLSCYGFFCVL